MSAAEVAEALLAQVTAAAGILSAMPEGCRAISGFTIDTTLEVVHEVARIRGVAVEPPFEGTHCTVIGLALVLGSVEVRVSHFIFKVRPESSAPEVLV